MFTPYIFQNIHKNYFLNAFCLKHSENLYNERLGNEEINYSFSI